MAKSLDINASPFNIGDYVNVRCLVTAADGLGAGGTVVLLVDTNGSVGEKTGVTLSVSPTQCRRSLGATNTQP